MSSAAEIAEDFEASLEFDFNREQPRILYAPSQPLSEHETSKEKTEAYARTALADVAFHEYEQSIGSMPTLPNPNDSLPFRPGTSGTDTQRPGRSNDEFPLSSLGRDTCELRVAERRLAEDRSVLAKMPTLRPPKSEDAFQSARREGWSLQKGWGARPKHKQAATGVVAENIRRWAAKQTKGRSRKSGCGQGVSARTDPSMWVMSPLYAHDKVPEAGTTAKTMTAIFDHRDTPGPRYNTRPDMPPRKGGVGNGRRTWDRPRTYNTSRARDITFQSHADPKYRPLKTFGADPTYYPEPMQVHKPAYSLGSSPGRTLYGSIYYEGAVVGGPGPAAALITTAFEATSRAIPANGPVRFGMGLDGAAVTEEFNRTRLGSPARPEDHMTRGQVKHLLGPWTKNKARGTAASSGGVRGGPSSPSIVPSVIGGMSMVSVSP